MLEITITLRPNGVAIVQPAGQIDIHSAFDFKQQVGETLAAGNHWLVIDFGAVTFLDSTGLGALVTILKRAQALGGDLHLAQVSKTVRMVIELTSLQSYLPRYATVADALAAYP